MASAGRPLAIRIGALAGPVLGVTMLVMCGGSQPPLSPAPTPTSTVLLRDDFTGPQLDSGTWIVPEGAGTFLGRTQLRPPSQPVEVANGFLRLRLDTYNPTALTPGDSFWGSEIDSRQLFPLGTGLSFVAHVRVVGPVVGGLVESFFGYALRGDVRDELDFELLTNDLDNQRVLTNVFTQEGFSSAGRPQYVPGVRLTDLNTYEMDWYPDTVQWKINGTLVREEHTNIPTQPMTVRLNFWAPAADFSQAFNQSLQPAANARDNQIFVYEVDDVEVRSLTASPSRRVARGTS